MFIKDTQWVHKILQKCLDELLAGHITKLAGVQKINKNIKCNEI